MQDLGGNRFRVLRIDTIGFTNQANGKEILTPINNRGASTNPAAREIQHEAAALMGRLVEEEKRSSGLPTSAALRMVANRMPALNSLAAGRLSAEDFFAVYPEMGALLRNRADGVTPADQKKANARTSKALDYLDGILISAPVAGIGEWLQSKDTSDSQVWFTFVSKVRRLMRDKGISCQDAFNQLKTEEPTFWMMAVQACPLDAP
jgi:hypothetical protein